MKSSKLSALIRSSQSQVSKAATILKKAEEKSGAIEPIYRESKVRLKEAKQSAKKAKADWKSSQKLLASERIRLSKLQRRLERLRRKAAKASLDKRAPKGNKPSLKT